MKSRPFIGQLGLPIRIRIKRIKRPTPKAHRQPRGKKLVAQELMIFPSNHPIKTYQLKIK